MTFWRRALRCCGAAAGLCLVLSSDDIAAQEPAAIPPGDPRETAEPRLSLPRGIAGRRFADPASAFSAPPAIAYGPATWRFSEALETPDFILRELQIDDAEALPPGALRHLYASVLGRRIDGVGLNDILYRVTDLHARAGFPARIAFLPEQDFADGVLRVSATTGDVDAVEVLGVRGATKRRLSALSAILLRDKPLREQTINKFLVLANRIPGVRCKVEIVTPGPPGSAPRVIVRADKVRVSGQVYIDNRAPRGIGREIISGTVAFNDLIGGMDGVEVQVIDNLGTGDAFIFEGSYFAVLSPRGLKAEINAFRSDISASLSGPDPLTFDIEFRSYEAELSRPLIATENFQLIGDAALLFSRASRSINDSLDVRDRRFMTALGFEVVAQDRWSGVTTVSTKWFRGWDAFGATARGDPFASRVGEGAGFSSVVIEAGRVQRFGAWGEIELTSWTQLATKPLFEADQCVYGGRDFGLGHEFETLFGDRCFLGLLELRAAPVAVPRVPVKFAPYAFVDGGVIDFLGTDGAAGLPVNALMSAGGGVRMSLSKNALARIEANWPLRRSGIDFSPTDQRIYFRLEAVF
ncbi:MAG: POTRA domain-containing protein [Pseudomonadota bacterium]